MPNFQVVSPYQPAGDQPQAIEKLTRGFHEGQNRQVLLGVILKHLQEIPSR